MPKFTAHRQAFNLYSPKRRLQEFPTASWQFLIRSAANAARAFTVVHEGGHVIGDVKHDNLLVGGNATVRLVDCDSYQITVNGSRWFCPVGTPTHQPPELQNIRTYKGVPRTPNHDNFGLAVIIFQMLFMARHPFSGRFLGTGEMPMERAISEYRFAYGSNAAAMQMQPPPASVGLNGVTRDVALLFERAFSKQGSQPNGRPRADEWITALQDLEQHLKRCAVNPAHQFVDTLSKCPWCEIEAATGVPLFQVAIVGSAQTGFTIAAFWAKVSSVPNPGPLPSLPRLEDQTVTLSPAVLELQQATPATNIASDLLVLTGRASRIRSLKEDLAKKASAARTRWQNIHSNWNTQTRSKDFQDIFSALQNLREQYERLPQKRLQALRKLESDRHRLQLKAYLDRFRISHARIRGVGDAKKATLQSYGIETAADIVDGRVLAVPGFGPALVSNLKQWRDQQERRFVFDPNKGVDHAAKNTVERQILAEKIDLERRLSEGLSKLTASSSHALTRRRAVLAQAQQAARDLAQAEADLRAAEQVARDVAQAEADLRAAEQAARDLAKAEPDLAAVAAVPSTPRPTQSTNVNAKTIGRAIFALGAISIGALIIASHQGRGPPPVPPQQVQPSAPAPVPPVQTTPPPHVERDPSGQLRPEDGYDWSDGRSVRWMPGKPSRQYSHVIASHIEGKWLPDDRYNWVNPANKSVSWMPGFASTLYPNVVAAAVEGQWRPADGYTWEVNPPRSGDMRVKPIQKPQNQYTNPPPASSFDQGLADRAEWELWLVGLSGDFRRGADWWADRSMKNPGACDGLIAAMSPQFISGCEAAKARLIPSDKKRDLAPDYKRGWNSYTGTTTPAPTPDRQAPTAAPNDADADAVKRLNEHELKRLKGR
jgi:DNA-binding helix-hairpin-helix protein with protein kinase domain